MQGVASDIRAQCVQLVEQVLRAGRPIEAEQPLAFGASFSGRRLYADVEGRVVSTVSILRRSLQVGQHQVEVGLIGSVVTDPAYRGRGLATQLLAKAEAELQADGASLCLLWADEREFYSERGYLPVGTELDYRVPVEMLDHLPHTGRVRPAAPADYAAIHALYQGHSERVLRNLAETRALLSGPGVTTLVHEQDGVIDGYAVEGRGEDLRGMVHEWGGARVPVLACLSGHLEGLAPDEDGLWWVVPASCVEMQTFLNDYQVEGLLGVLAMGKLLDPVGAARWLEAVTPQEVTVAVEGAGLRVFGPGGEIFLDPAHCLLTLLPPQVNRELIEVVEASVGVALPELPQQPFLWGLDSI